VAGGQAALVVAGAGVTGKAAAAGVRAAGYGSRVAIHGARHTFGRLGRLSHIQANTWQIGAKGSGRAFRIPLPGR